MKNKIIPFYLPKEGVDDERAPLLIHLQSLDIRTLEDAVIKEGIEGEGDRVDGAAVTVDPSGCIFADIWMLGHRVKGHMVKIERYDKRSIDIHPICKTDISG